MLFAVMLVCNVAPEACGIRLALDVIRVDLRTAFGFDNQLFRLCLCHEVRLVLRMVAADPLMLVGRRLIRERKYSGRPWRKGCDVLGNQ